MIYTEHDKLTIITLEKKSDCLSFEQIGKVLKERPSNVIYCELHGKLYGVISMGDVERAKSAGKKEVKVNRVFTSAVPSDYMKVRQIFKERNKINAIPVVDENGRLLGDYARWDDLLVLEYINWFANNQYAADFWEENSHVALVKPCDIFPKKNQMFEKWKSELEHMGVMVDIIDRMSVPEYLDRVKLFLFVDEDEKRGGFTLIGRILDQEFVWDKAATYKQCASRIKDEIKRRSTEKILNVVKTAWRGGHILAIQFSDNGSEYYQRIIKEIDHKFTCADIPKSAKLPSSAMRDFFEELYTEEYAKTILNLPFKSEPLGIARKLKDTSGKYLNAKNGERLTTGQPDVYDKTVYFFGPCVILGQYVEDKNTIESFLQEQCNSKGIRCRVVNLGCFEYALGTLDRIVRTPIKKEDIIVINFMNEKELEGIDDLNLTDVLEENNVPSKWFVERFRHCNHRVNRICADAIYDKLESVLKESVSPSNELIDIDRDIVVNTYAGQYCKHYFTGFMPARYSTIGSIVMNCNPFTNGHRYLIEEALKTVDFLIIFVVEEDQSVFTFNERFALVNAGVADLQNVMVVPSGEFILSQRTVPEYFLKVEDEDLIQNVEHDITLFAEYIAPRLNITYRFVGEEPQDRVTNEYNRAMKRILPGKGINVIEIPRKENENGIVSASRVRKCLEENNLSELEKMVPKSTLEILGFRM